MNDLDFFTPGARLALELECLLMDTRNDAAQSRWWDSAHEALEQWRQAVRAMEAAIDAAQAQPKRRPYNASASLSEYGIFPECDAAPAAQAPRACTCHPDDRPDGPCRERYAASECQALAALAKEVE